MGTPRTEARKAARKRKRTAELKEDLPPGYTQEEYDAIETKRIEEEHNKKWYEIVDFGTSGDKGDTNPREAPSWGKGQYETKNWRYYRQKIAKKTQ